MSDNESETTRTVFVCRKCPGETFEESQREEHRIFHRQQRASVAAGPPAKKAKPGPASKTRRLRDASPTPSDATLFTTQQDASRSRVTRSKNARNEGTADEDDPEDNSASARRSRSFRNHIQNSRVFNMKNTGG